ncbi:hypothetical protein [Xanthovirga aplysinae]|uniref:hypothetical protein n=1 Tax=Xanthovirga aplysinae TaxID=2529853 RepID=UPI0012BCF7BF|nr:hypothetical protein [Xanthovirga aplysinae]MTI33154.1 hypothetical protein [Xanthovirga aplysinae]
MKRLTCLINIAKYEFTSVNEVRVNSSWDLLTDTATIVLPRKVQWSENDSLVSGDNSFFKRGDEVSIQLGYDDNNEVIFEGFISALKLGTNLEIQCEDAAKDLKSGNGTFNKKEPATLKEFLDKVSTIPFEADPLELGSFKTKEDSPAKALQKLREKFHLTTFAREGKLYVGPDFWPDLQQKEVPVFTFQQDIISDELTYKREEDVLYQVIAKSKMPDDTTIEVKEGDEENADNKTLEYDNMPEAQLKERAKAVLDRVKYEGFEGSITTFGTPVVRHGDVLELKNPKYPNAERNGKFLVKAVETTFGQGGYRQKITLNAKM